MIFLKLASSFKQEQKMTAVEDMLQVILGLIFAGKVFYRQRNWDSIVGIATGYRLDDGVIGFRVLVGSRIFSTSSRLVLGPTQPTIQWVQGLFPQG
jgi:hypothetical protein